MPLRVVIPETPFSRALFDGSVTVDGFDVEFVRASYEGTDGRRLRGRMEPTVAGAEQVIPDYLLRLSRGIGQPLVALPIFLTRGMVHRKYVGRVRGPRPGDLSGRRIGLSRVLSASVVHLRGVLTGTYSLEREQATWVAGDPVTSDDAMDQEWAHLRERIEVPARELLGMLADGELDAVLYPGGGGGNLYHWVDSSKEEAAISGHGDLDALVRERPGLEFSIGSRDETREWFADTGVYPLFHMVAVQPEAADQHSGLSEALLDAFDRAAARVPNYLSSPQRRLYDEEQRLLGVDPNRPGLTPLNLRSIAYQLDVLEADGILRRRPALEEIFPA